MADTVDLEYLAYDLAKFAHSDREPTSMDSRIKGPRPFYYMWRKNGGMEILIIEDSAKPETARFFRYSRRKIYQGVDLEKDKPALRGMAIIEHLKKEIRVPADYFEN